MQRTEVDQSPEFSRRAALVMRSPYWMNLPGESAVERQRQRDRLTDAIATAADYDSLPPAVRQHFDAAEAAMGSNDQIPGGKADNVPDSKFDPKSLSYGAQVESEHTDDPGKAREIAKDHLTEDKDYYDKLKAVEGATP